MPLVRPATVAVVAAPVEEAVKPPGVEVTVYPVIAEPPVSVGAVHDTVACVFPDVAPTAVGAPGTIEGITAEEGLDATEAPRILVAVTLNV